MHGVTGVCGLAIVVGLLGIVLPLLPGLILIWAAAAGWGAYLGGPVGWTVFGVATVLTAIGLVVKYLWPGRRLRDAGVPWPTMAAGAVLGIVGFFVVPVVGLPLGFVLGIYLAEYLRLHAQGPAWRSTRHALAAVGLSMLLELFTGLLVAGTWLAGVYLR